MTFKILRRPFQPDRLLGDSPAPQATLFCCATGFAFIAAAAIVSFTKDPPVAIAGILFFLAFIASLVLLILGMAARRG